MTIVGDNLGKHVADIDNGVTVANGKCAVEDNPYEPSIQSVESTCRMFCVRVCIYVRICVQDRLQGRGQPRFREGRRSCASECQQEVSGCVH